MKSMDNEELIKKWEKLKLKAYLPTPDDVWTIGWGHTLDVKQGDVISVATAEAYFDDDKDWAEEAVNTSVKVPLTQPQFDALVSLVFNIGATAFAKSTLLKKLNRSDYQGAADQFLRWDKQKGIQLKGLVRRRTEEREYFLSSATIAGSGSATVDKEVKPSVITPETVTGAVAVVTGLSALATQAQLIAIVGLVLVGLFVIWKKLH